MSTKSIFVVLFFFLLLSSCSSSTFYVVRHAERQSATDDTTPLSDTGKARANKLADLLADKGIDSVYSSKYLRCTQTAQPLANRLNQTILLYNPNPTTEIVNRLQGIKSKKVLVVGHSNTVLEIVKGLGGKPTIQKIEAGDYDNLFILQIKKGLSGKKVSLQETKFGAI
jgi:phosphohistidine phosphatase SixA